MAYVFPGELRDDGATVLEAQAAVQTTQTAAENLALEMEHSESIGRETEIANEMNKPVNEQSSIEPGYLQDVPDFFGMSFDDVEPQPCSSQGTDVTAAVAPGYSADNAFGFARVAIQPKGFKLFWETGFRNDCMNPDKIFLSAFYGNFKRPFDTTLGGPGGKTVEVVEREPKTLKQAGTFMDHVRDVSFLSWKDPRDAEWQVDVFKWHAMLSVWDPKVLMVVQMVALDGFGVQAQLVFNFFCNIAPVTIVKIFCSMSRMTNCFAARGRVFPCDEPQVYEFMCVECGMGAPCSQSKGYIEALTFCRHVLGVAEFDSAAVSRRWQGVAALDVHYK